MAASGNDPEDPVLGEINVTPLVDVMLVLLIIFMVTAPMLHQGITVALPRAEAQSLPPSSKDPLIISIKKDGTIYLRDQPVHATQLVERLRPMLRAPSGDNVFLRGDREVAYGRVIEVLEVLRQAGIVNVGMVTEPQRGGKPQR